MNNTNLLNNILSYLKPKDFANLEVVSRDYKLKAENFRNYWREDLNNLLCENKQIEEELLKQNFEINSFSFVEEKGTFKNLYKDYILNRKFMQNFTICEKEITINSEFPTSDFNNSNIQEDLIFTENLISQVFREFFESPELRRKNYYLENEYNTTHQINNFDFIYKQQDIYEYYDEILGNKNIDSQINSNKLEESPTLSKRPDLPFSALLNNISSILYLFRKEDNLEQKMILAKLRWYCNDDKANNYHNDHNDYLCNFGSPCAPSAPCGTNPLNIILSTIFSKISIFCRFSYQYITKYQNFNKNSFSYDDTNTNQILDQLLIHEYIKRSKSFFQAAIYLDAQLENLNVIVNYCYENEFKNYPCFPKFSIYRLLVVIWNKEVLAPLVETGNQNLNILLKIQKMYKNYLESKIEEIGKNDSESGSGSKFKFNLSCDYRYFSQNYQERKNLNDPKLIKYLIEEIASSLVDMDCNEYSTFFLNHSQMKISRNYSILENLLSNTFEEVLRKYFSASCVNGNVNGNAKGIFSSNSNSNSNSTNNINFIPVLNYFKDLGLDCHPTHPRLINRTRNLLMKILCKFGVDFSLDYITKIFESNLKNNYSLLSEQKIDNFFLETRNKLNQCNFDLYLLKFKEDNLNQEIQLIQEGLFKLAKEFLFLTNKCKNENLARLLTINFIREFSLEKTNFEYLKLLEEAMILFNEDLERLKFLDKKITKETNRRNIPFDSSENFFLKFDQVEFSQVEQIYLSNLKLDISYIQIFSKCNKGFLQEKESYEISMKDDYSDSSDNSDNSTASSLSSSLQSPGRIHEDINMELEYYL